MSEDHINYIVRSEAKDIENAALSIAADVERDEVPQKSVLMRILTTIAVKARFIQKVANSGEKS